MEQINFESNKQYIYKQSNVRNKDLNFQESKTQNTDIQFRDLLSNITDTSLDEKSANIVSNLIQKYNISISVHPSQSDRSSVNKKPLIFGNMDVSGNNNLVVIPQNLLNKMANDPQMMESVEYAIKSDIKAYKEGESFRQITADKSISSPLTFNDDGTWEKWGMSVTDSNNFNSSSKKLGQEESKEKKSTDKYLNKIASTIGKVEELEIPNLKSGTQSSNGALNNCLNGINNFRRYQFMGFDKTNNSSNKSET